MAIKTVQLHLSPDQRWIACSRSVIEPATQLALVFWSEQSPAALLASIAELRAKVPEAIILGCSTGGIIQDRLLLDSGVSATLASFSHTKLRAVRSKLSEHTDSFQLGCALAEALPRQDLKHVFVLCDGLKINGSKLVEGISEHLSPEISVTGGLAGDGINFRCTQLLLDDEILEGEVVALGFYGAKLHVGFGSQGGFEPFGPERLITKAQDNVLFELDGESALDLYIKYLGKHAHNLPASGHLFPLGLRSGENGQMLIRSIMSVDRERKALLFSGDMPTGAIVQLMRGNMDALIEGARHASEQASQMHAGNLAVLVSCIGRKQALRQFADEEIEAVATSLPAGAALTGFYSYGEFAPRGTHSSCLLHNQTMTVTIFGEED